jgi:PAS domain S-box-containing protein
VCKSPHARHSVAAKRDRSASNSEVGGFVNHEGIGLSSVSFVIPLSARYTPLAPTTVQPALPDYGRSGAIVPRPLCVLSPPVYCAALLVPLDHFWQFHRFELFTVLTGASLLILLLVRAVLRWKRAEDVARRKGADLVDAQRAAKLGSWCWSPTTDTFTCSGTFFTVTRLDPELPVTSKQLSQVLTSESWQQLSRTMNESLRTGRTFELELEGAGSNTSGAWFVVHGERVRNRTDPVGQLRGTIQDFTERRRAEEDRLMLAAIVDSSDDAVLSEDLHGCVTSWNRGAERIFGYRESEILGRPFAVLLPPELREEQELIVRRTLAGERVTHNETVHIGKSGDRISISLSMSPLKNFSGRVIGVSRIARDITQRKQAEERIRKSEEKFAKIVRQGPLAITLTNAKTQRYMDVNKTFEELSGYTREELIGRTVPELGIWIDPGARTRLMQQVIIAGSLHDLEFQYRRKNGDVRVAQASAELIEIDGEPCVLGMALDITHRKEAEEALRESEKRFRLMADSAPVLMWLSGPDKLYTDFNKAWLQFTGCTLEQEKGEGWTERIHPDDRQGSLRAYTQAFEARESFTTEYRLLRNDGQYRWVLNRGAPRFLQGGGFNGYIGCCVDITEEVVAKAERTELSGRLILAQEQERARIARELHDDINQRMALLANGLAGLEQASARDNPALASELQELWQVTDDIANDIQHLSHQLHPSKLRDLGLSAAVRGLCQEFSKQHRIDTKWAVKDVPRDLEEYISLNLFRVAQEALHNAAKHGRARHVLVDLEAEAGTIHLRVVDDGVGFTNVETRQGLGLVSMRERVRLAGGNFTLRTRPDMGTQIEARVPIRLKPPTELAS